MNFKYIYILTYGPEGAPGVFKGSGSGDFFRTEALAFSLETNRGAGGPSLHLLPVLRVAAQFFAPDPSKKVADRGCPMKNQAERGLKLHHSLGLLATLRGSNFGEQAASASEMVWSLPVWGLRSGKTPTYPPKIRSSIPQTNPKGCQTIGFPSNQPATGTLNKNELQCVSRFVRFL